MIAKNLIECGVTYYQGNFNADDFYAEIVVKNINDDGTIGIVGEESPRFMCLSTMANHAHLTSKEASAEMIEYLLGLTNGIAVQEAIKRAKVYAADYYPELLV